MAETRQNKPEDKTYLLELESIYKLAPIGLAVFDDQLRYVRVNDKLAEINGISADQHIGRTVHEIVPDLAEQAEAICRQIIKTGEPVLDIEFVGTTAAQPGLQRTWIEHWSPLKDAEGKIIGINVVVEEITERKQAEDALRESDARFRVAQELSPDGFTILRPVRDTAGNVVDFTWVYENDAIARLNGTDPHAVLGKSLLSLFPGHQDSQFFEMYIRTAVTGETSIFEEMYQGETITNPTWFRIVVVRMNGDIAILTQDITERKRREANFAFLTEVDRDFASLSSADEIIEKVGAKIGSYLNIETCNFCEVNDPGDEITVIFDWHRDGTPGLRRTFRISDYYSDGFKKSSREGRTIIIRDTQTDSCTDAGAYAALNLYSFLSVPFLRENEWTNSLTVTDSRVRDWQKDEIELFQELATRIFPRVQRARTEEALRQALTRAEKGDRMLSALMEYVPEGITVTDAVMNLVRVSRYAQELLGGRHEGKSIADVAAQWKIYHADGITPMDFEDLPLVKAVQCGEVVKNIELVQVNSMGERLPLLVTAGPIQDADGKVAGGVVVWRDITYYKQAQEALRRINETLEKKVAERTELAEARSKQLQFLAAELIEAEENERQRIAEILHDDLQQILASARIQLQAACADLPSQPMLANVGKLLEESIAKSRRLSHELSPTLLHHSNLTTGLKWLSRQMSEQFGMEIRLEEDAPHEFKSMPLKLFMFRAVQELLFNIAKHAGVKDAEVVLSGSDDSLTICVSDHGCGFNPNILESSGTKTGLGLLSLRERASYIGGSFTIESTPGQGSRLSLTLPRSLDKDILRWSKPEARKQLHAKAVLVSAKTEGVRILFVDDHHVMRQALIGLFNDHPYIRVVGEAANGREALELARKLRPDVILMDISMPEMDGIEATRRIKAEMPEVLVIGLSMFDDEVTVQSMRQAGADGYVSKTASTEGLLKEIYRIIGYQEDKFSAKKAEGKKKKP
jgi:PAS domain S-box-containing protein